MWHFPVRKWVALCCSLWLCSGCHGRCRRRGKYSIKLWPSFAEFWCRAIAVSTGAALRKGRARYHGLFLTLKSPGQTPFRVSKCFGSRDASGFLPATDREYGLWALFAKACKKGSAVSMSTQQSRPAGWFPCLALHGCSARQDSSTEWENWELWPLAWFPFTCLTWWGRKTPKGP